jgi:hypothetical protein
LARALGSIRDWFGRWLRDRADEAVLKWVFRAMLVTTAIVLALDFSERWAQAPEHSSLLTPMVAPGRQKMPARHDGDERRYAPLQSDPQLAAAMTFDLLGDGRLLATGRIDPGTAERLKAEIAKRGRYVKTIVLHSPGGSVADALAMGRLIRQEGFATAVDDRRYCASSCPLVFAGGVERVAGEQAVIGVHQVFAAPGEDMTDEIGMAGAQVVSAECQRYLHEMGVDLDVWIDAMETAKDQLFVFRPEELLALKLATRTGKASRPAGPEARARS